MKKLLVFTICLMVFANMTKAQYQPTYSSGEKPLKLIYVGLGSGLNYKYGALGVSFGMRFAPKTIGEVQFGSGVWGSKVGFSVTTNVLNKNAWCPSLGFTRSLGRTDIETPVSVQVKGTTDEFNTTANLNYQPMNLINAGVQRQLVGKNGNRLVFELGVAIGISAGEVTFSDPFVIREGVAIPTATLEFTTVQKQAFKILNPAGIMLGINYQFSFGKYN